MMERESGGPPVTRKVDAPLPLETPVQGAPPHAAQAQAYLTFVRLLQRLPEAPVLERQLLRDEASFANPVPGHAAHVALHVPSLAFGAVAASSSSSSAAGARAAQDGRRRAETLRIVQLEGLLGEIGCYVGDCVTANDYAKRLDEVLRRQFDVDRPLSTELADPRSLANASDRTKRLLRRGVTSSCGADCDDARRAVVVLRGRVEDLEAEVRRARGVAREAAMIGVTAAELRRELGELRTSAQLAALDCVAMAGEGLQEIARRTGSAVPVGAISKLKEAENAEALRALRKAQPLHDAGAVCRATCAALLTEAAASLYAGAPRAFDADAPLAPVVAALAAEDPAVAAAVPAAAMTLQLRLDDAASDEGATTLDALVREMGVEAAPTSLRANWDVLRAAPARDGRATEFAGAVATVAVRMHAIASLARWLGVERASLRAELRDVAQQNVALRAELALQAASTPSSSSPPPPGATAARKAPTPATERRPVRAQRGGGDNPMDSPVTAPRPARRGAGREGGVGKGPTGGLKRRNTSSAKPVVPATPVRSSSSSSSSSSGGGGCCAAPRDSGLAVDATASALPQPLDAQAAASPEDPQAAASQSPPPRWADESVLTAARVSTEASPPAGHTPAPTDQPPAAAAGVCPGSTLLLDDRRRGAAVLLRVQGDLREMAAALAADDDATAAAETQRDADAVQRLAKWLSGATSEAATGTADMDIAPVADLAAADAAAAGAAARFSSHRPADDPRIRVDTALVGAASTPSPPDATAPPSVGGAPRQRPPTLRAAATTSAAVVTSPQDAAAAATTTTTRTEINRPTTPPTTAAADTSNAQQRRTVPPAPAATLPVPAFMRAGAAVPSPFAVPSTVTTTATTSTSSSGSGGGGRSISAADASTAGSHPEPLAALAAQRKRRNQLPLPLRPLQQPAPAPGARVESTAAAEDDAAYAATTELARLRNALRSLPQLAAGGSPSQRRLRGREVPVAHPLSDPPRDLAAPSDAGTSAHFFFAAECGMPTPSAPATDGGESGVGTGGTPLRRLV